MPRYNGGLFGAKHESVHTGCRLILLRSNKRMLFTRMPLRDLRMLALLISTGALLRRHRILTIPTVRSRCINAAALWRADQSRDRQEGGRRRDRRDDKTKLECVLRLGRHASSASGESGSPISGRQVA